MQMLGYNDSPALLPAGERTIISIMNRASGKRSAILVILAVAVAAALPVAAEPFLPGTDINNASVLQLMNFYRGLHGVAPLREDPRLSAAAADRMRDMEELQYFSHESPDGRSPFVWVRLRGYDFLRAGENLAAGFETAQILVTAWMESKGHRENILSSEYRDVGMAIIPGAPNSRAVGKSIVILFAREKPFALAAAR
ncbi:MAG TPA: CAP domain-containing protein [Thermoanaerobaculia bacterium]|nr:CAP domain-containing protein [Thermoanaerobaculia bacterium]